MGGRRLQDGGRAGKLAAEASVVPAKVVARGNPG